MTYFDKATLSFIREIFEPRIGYAVLRDCAELDIADARLLI